MPAPTIKTEVTIGNAHLVIQLAAVSIIASVSTKIKTIVKEMTVARKSFTMFFIPYSSLSGSYSRKLLLI